MTKRHWLDISETIAIAGSILGTIAATGTGQFVYAVTPLTLAVGLNLANRQRIDRGDRLETETAIAHLHESIQSLPEATNLEAIERRMQGVEWEAQQLVSERKTEIKDLKQDLRGELEAAIAPIYDRLNPLQENFDALDEFVADLERETNERFDRLKTEITQDLEQHLETTLENALSSWGDRLENLENRPAIDAETQAEFDRFKQTILEQTQEAIDRVHQFMESLPPLPNLDAIYRRLEQLDAIADDWKQTREHHDRAISTLQAAIDTQQAAIGPLKAEIESLQGLEQIDSVEKRLDRLETTLQELAETTKLQLEQLSELLNLSDETAESAQLHDLIKSIPSSPSLEATYQRLDLLESRTEQIERERTQYSDRLDAHQEDNQGAISDVLQRLANVQDRLERLEFLAQNQPSSPPTPRLNLADLSNVSVTRDEWDDWDDAWQNEPTPPPASEPEPPPPATPLPELTTSAPPPPSGAYGCQGQTSAIGTPYPSSSPD
ncbi:MAG: hypothetical protein D6680_08330, partial [Cyanobacteria bacterium J007]